ncbi:hypothetical protein [Brucella anthropi]|uniref:hypothetical protein n=1 Tax=Brucella anthropi TaxID=529 RepID=UPI003988118D
MRGRFARTITFTAVHRHRNPVDRDRHTGKRQHREKVLSNSLTERNKAAVLQARISLRGFFCNPQLFHQILKMFENYMGIEIHNRFDRRNALPWPRMVSRIQLCPATEYLEAQNAPHQTCPQDW